MFEEWLQKFTSRSCLSSHFPVSWILSQGWVFFLLQVYLCTALLLRDWCTNRSCLQVSSHGVTNQDWYSGTTQKRIMVISLVLGWTQWQKVLGQGVSLNTIQLLKHWCASSCSASEAHLGLIGQDTRVCFHLRLAGVTAERCSQCLLTGQLHLSYCCPAHLVCFTASICLKLCVMVI